MSDRNVDVSKVKNTNCAHATWLSFLTGENRDGLEKLIRATYVSLCKRGCAHPSMTHIIYIIRHIRLTYHAYPSAYGETFTNLSHISHSMYKGLVTPWRQWRQWSRSTLVQVMACCLTASSHYLNQCWLIISEAQWYLSHQALKLLWN